MNNKNHVIWNKNEVVEGMQRSVVKVVENVIWKMIDVSPIIRKYWESGVGKKKTIF